jgi:hypothetical protein
MRYSAMKSSSMSLLLLDHLRTEGHKDRCLINSIAFQYDQVIQQPLKTPSPIYAHLVFVHSQNRFCCVQDA